MRALLAAALGAGLALLAPGAAAQEDERGFLVRFLEDNLSGAGRVVHIEGFAGALSSRATIRQMSIADDAGVWITLNDVTLQWNRGALLSGRIEVEALTAAEVLLPRMPEAGGDAAGLPAPEAAGFSLPDLPVSVAIGTVAAARVEIGAAVLGQAAVVRIDGTMQLAGGEGAARLGVERIDGAAGRFDVDAAFANATRVLRLAVTLDEGPEGIAAGLIGLPGAPALALGLQGEGPLDAFGAEMRLATGGQERVTGSLTLAGGPGGERRFRAMLGGEVAALVAPAYAGFFGPETRLVAEGTAYPDGRLEMPLLAASAAAARLAGRLTVAADGLPQAFELNLRIAAADGAPLLLPLAGGPTRVGRAELRMGFDAARSDDWTLAAEVVGFDGPAMAFDRLVLAGEGRIARGPGGPRVHAAVDLDGTGLRPADPALAEALGPVLRGRAVADWQQGRPLVLPDLRVEGAGYGVSAALILHAGTGGPLAVEGRGLLRFDDLARLSALAGQPLGGNGLASFRGRFEPASGATDGAVALAGQDLALGVAEIDGLLAGRSRVALDLLRDASGTTVRALSVAATTLRLDGAGSIRSAGSSFDARLSFADLAVLGPGWGGAAEAGLAVRPRGAPGGESIAFSATGRDLRTGIAELDRLLAGESRITFAGTREGAALVVEQLEVAAGTLAAAAAGRIAPGATALTAEVAFADLAALGRPWGGALAATASLREADGAQSLAVEGTAEGLAIGIAEIDRLLSGRATVAAELRRAGDDITVERFAVAAASLAAEGSGVLRPAGSDLVARLTFADLAALGPGWGGAAEADLRLSPGGAGAEAIRLRAEGRDLAVGVAELDRLLAGTSTVTLEATRRGAEVGIGMLAVDAGALRLRGAGQAGASGSRLAADVALADLAALGPPWGGALAGRIEARLAGGEQALSFAGGLRDVALGVPEVERLLAGEASIAFEARRGGDGAVEVPALSVEAAGVAARGAASLAGGVARLGLDVILPDLGRLGLGLGGALAARLDAEDAAGVQRLALAGSGRGLSAGIAPLDRLLAGETRITLDARRQGETVDIAWATLEAGGLAARASGRIRPGASDLAADLVASDLARAGPGWGGALTAEARLVEAGAVRRLRLGGVGRSLRLGNPAADAILSGEMRLLAEAEEEGGRIRLNRLALTGPRLTAEASGTHDGAAGQVTLSARLADLATLLPGFPGPLTAGGTIGQGPAGYTLDLRADGPGGIAVRLAGGVAPDLGRADLAVTGGAVLGLANPFIMPRSVAGAARFDLALRGPLAAASLSGQVTAEGARLVDPTYGVTLEDLGLAVTLAGGQATLSAAGRVQGGGRIAVDGPVALSAPFAADLSARLERARFTDPALYDTRVSGALSVTGPLAGGARIAGTLGLDETELRIPSTGLGGSAPVPPLRHVGEPAEVRATRARAGLDAAAADDAAAPARPFALALRIEAPRRIFVRGRGLDAELGGALELAGTTAAVVPIGGFSLIRGRLDLLGRRFQLTEGQAQLQGQFAPYLRLAAVTEAEGITVRIEVEGEATEPAIRFLSAPELPEEEVLARLLFGKGIETISALQAAQLASAVATLAGRGGEGVVGRLRRGFGLDDLDVSTDADGTAAVRAGRYLTENIYTDVTVGADGRSAVRLNIDVSPSLTVRGTATSDGRTGIGLFFERDY
ncbi:MAG: translocation/assembly module TamB domain-containing protein [Rhodobacteraceae bacterium]|jgi:translocation and assembly module TamB|nr:translocation/assembly module TamB domain-containing protein [Paracoccaceae bacterium]